MPRKKKSRKVGQIGVPSVSKEQRKRKPASPDKVKIGKGNKSGSRHSAPAEQNKQENKAYKDPRVGSKKPVQLIVDPVNESKAAVAHKKSTFFTPTQELAALEENDRLNDLLDQLDDGATLSTEDKNFVDLSLARHKVLCELLGIDQQEEQLKAEEDDPLARLNAIDINKFK